ncbi:UDP-N-acetylmuramoylalanyl-D-glutamate--2,6-diaminopimelate ligase [Balneicella halophila]|uniref:UDP-N-acetylmuramoyl-L-alanyl-D-glutamate--2,6-diaminopimelate ligase n=1 Tax=Balneicella halophila TaxID=1537566 RepID=A0A7L4URI5_BALHA|nr:UDP-N-acetylmuramoyl-L-alanyl-D-glutamate--2,6-diaminopimelate ligase [Balneicella halophila]PVX50939.1 UDP-N-acetylmuramoylalanyl-D-glutamate--2,6-diaminopimelate ligase [Balneicella halophila]
MKTLAGLIKNCDVKKYQGDLDVKVSSVCFDSRNVQEGTLYVAQRGTQVDGHQFISKAIRSGATCVVCETMPQTIYDNVTYVLVENTARALGQIASLFYDEPSKELKLVGVTGTNGKTSIVTLLYKMFNKLGYKVGLLSTIANYVGEKEHKATHTTPDAVQLNVLLRDMVNEGCEYCFMEVSSHALVQHRVAGVHFIGGIFTNLTHDHLDYHETFKSYLTAKKSFFDKLPKDSFALTNIDDRNGEVMLQNTKAKQYAYAAKSLGDFNVKILERHFDTTLMEFNGTEVWTQFIGDFNAYNLLAVYATACLLDIPEQSTLVALSTLEPVAGRLDTYVSGSGITAVVDYAHTPDALENVLKTLKGIVDDGQIITVVGAGGNRDKTKRPKMARIACEYSNRVILTSDNPRNEQPESIIEDMFNGVPEEQKLATLCVTNRREAIKMAALLAVKGDLILIAGKGHETYQEVEDKRNYFNDKEEIKQILN